MRRRRRLARARLVRGWLARGGGRGEDGQVLLLVIGFVVIVALLVTVVANASTAFLARRSLSAWADGAATAAAQSVDEGAVYGGRVGQALPLSAARARAAVAGYAVRNGLPGRFEGFEVAAVEVDPGAGTVRVALATSVDLAFANVVSARWADGVPITATATARVPLG